MPILRQFLRQSGTALRALLVLTVLLGICYPAAVLAAGRVVPDRADGSMLEVDGRVVGSALLAMPPSGPQWFAGRPSASDASGETSGGSNLTPVGSEQAGEVATRAAALRKANPQATGGIPMDALTMSASGLDPDISVAYARYQVPRVAAARGISREQLYTLIRQHTESAALGFIGQERVNVPRLNLALAKNHASR
ncbi:K(+)-transporting ATPase subunit C [Dermacoccaceae bacterium W4C1]